MSKRPDLVALFNRLNKMGTFDEDLFANVRATDGDDENALPLPARKNDLEKQLT